MGFYKKVIAWTLVTVLVLASGVYLYSKKKKPPTIGTLKVGSVVESVYGIGTLYPSQIYRLKTSSVGVVETIRVKEGQWVKKGQVLLEIYGLKPFQAPFEGYITSLTIKEGETAFPQSPLLTLTGTKDLYLLVSVEQIGFMKIKKGMPAKLSFEGLREESFQGIVESTYADESRFFVRISPASLPQVIFPGLTADVAILIQTHDHLTLAPIKAIHLGRLRLLDNNQVKEIEIKTGLSDGEYVEIKSPALLKGTQVLLEDSAK